MWASAAPSAEGAARSQGGPAIKRALRMQPGWCVLRLVYADDTLSVAVARRAAPPQGGLIWARWRPLRVVVRGWLHFRRTPQGLYEPVAEAWELVGTAPGAGAGQMSRVERCGGSRP